MAVSAVSIGVPTECSSECGDLWVPFLDTCSDFLALNLPQLGPDSDFSESCEAAQRPFGPIQRPPPPSP
eukprot:SAG31_NODE_19160_length_610_cov_1.289628_1_plen_68_part_10